MHRLNIVLAVIFITACASSAEQPKASFTTKYISSIVHALADDSMNGRAAGTPENLKAAFFLANEFAKAGLKSVGTFKASPLDETNGTAFADSLRKYFQKFAVVKSRLAPGSLSLSTVTAIDGGSLTKQYHNPVDYFIQARGQTNLHAETRVMFCGYGIDSAGTDYTDYRLKNGVQADLRGAAVLVFEGYPGQADSLGPFSKKRSGLVVNPLRKAEAAQKRGAVALLIVEPRKEGTPSFEQRYEGYEHTVAVQNHMLPGKTDPSIPVIFVSRKIARDLLMKTDDELDSMACAIDRSYTSEPVVVPGKKIAFDVVFETERILAQNVVGILPGTDPVLRNEYIIIGAHYDHVGRGTFGSTKKFVGQIHNGADDNASGTAGLLQTIRTLSAAERKRSIVFIAFCAEEMGLLGSSFYVNEQPLVPLKNTIAMLNLDMIGRNEPQLLWLAGAFYSSDMKTLADRVNARDGVFALLYNTGILNFASDQGPFLRKKIPAIFFFTGLHDDYHTPADKANLIDYDKIARVAAFASSVALELVTTAQHPLFKELALPERTALIQESMQKLNALRPKSKQQTHDQQIRTEEQ